VITALADRGFHAPFGDSLHLAQDFRADFLRRFSQHAGQSVDSGIHFGTGKCSSTSSARAAHEALDAGDHPLRFQRAAAQRLFPNLHRVPSRPIHTALGVMRLPSSLANRNRKPRVHHAHGGIGGPQVDAQYDLAHVAATLAAAARRVNARLDPGFTLPC
jgi:hypothetical protein